VGFQYFVDVANKTMNPKLVLAFALVAAALLPCCAAERPGRKFTTVERLDRAHLQAVHEARSKWEEMRKNPPLGSRRTNTGIYNDYRAVIHVHAQDSKHTGGTRAEVLAAAKKTGVDVVMFSDHRGPMPETWSGLKEGVLFIPGSEDDDGKLRFPALNPTKDSDLKFICHIEERYDADGEGFIGMEIYNRHTDTKDDGDFESWFIKLIGDQERWKAFAELYKEFPDEIFGAGADYWPEILTKWDSETIKKPFTGIGANDAHQNQVFNGLMLDPYEVSFRNLSTHILARELTDQAIRQSLREGHVYVSHDWLCDPKGFGFVAVNNLGVFNIGDPVTIVGNTRLYVQTAIPGARIKLFHNGALKEEKTGDLVTNFETKSPGAYRVEVWLDVDGEQRPWIYSNPIYLKEPGLAELMMLPSMDTRSNVVVKSHIIYTDGKPEDEPKHKLDIYLPKEKQKAPVFFFVHGGAWVSGDRSQYPPLGNRYAGEGIITVVPSYRLAPKNRFPAQIEDVAASFAWTVRHIGEFGGDTNRIYIGGHSAGGHLASLLIMNQKWLKDVGVSPEIIKGTIGLSGVYDMSEGKDNVFDSDPELRREASPLFQIRKVNSPFLITYCEWDYYPLAIQAKEFHAALEKNGTASKIVFVPKESHISEMLSVTKPEDLTAQSVRDFILGPAQHALP
jgi:acetyl esterase/lipase